MAYFWDMENKKPEPAGNLKNDPLAPPQRRKPKIKILFIALLGLIVLAGVIVYYINDVAPYESTDDAFIDGYITLLSSRVPGQVTRLLVVDNQMVKAGDVLLEIDPRDYQTALSQARADLVVAQGQLERSYAEVSVAQAKVTETQSAVIAAQAQAQKADNDLERYESVESQAISKTDFDSTKSQALAANANLDAAKAQVKGAQSSVLLSQADEASAKAAVLQAQAKLQQAQLNLSYTKIIAPRDGRVTARSVQLGNYLQAGQVLLAIVSKDVWVTANFKETQLAHMRPGQPVELIIDAYPNRKFKAKVDSLQTGTGARFSLLPPENAVGNYVKVVQRVPVKIVFDEPLPDDLDISPGMSVDPTVKVK